MAADPTNPAASHTIERAKSSVFFDVRDLALLDRLAARWQTGRATVIRKAVREWLEQHHGATLDEGAA